MRKFAGAMLAERWCSFAAIGTAASPKGTYAAVAQSARRRSHSAGWRDIDVGDTVHSSWWWQTPCADIDFEHEKKACRGAGAHRRKKWAADRLRSRIGRPSTRR